MYDLNFCIVQGRLAMEPKLSYLSNETARAFFTVACNTGNGDGETQFIPVNTFGQPAEYVTRYGKKGAEVTVWGTINSRSWKDDDGEWQTQTNLKARRVKIHRGKSDDESEDESPRSGPRRNISEPSDMGDLLKEADLEFNQELQDLADSLLD